MVCITRLQINVGRQEVVLLLEGCHTSDAACICIHIPGQGTWSLIANLAKLISMSSTSGQIPTSSTDGTSGSHGIASVILNAVRLSKMSGENKFEKNTRHRE